MKKISFALLASVLCFAGAVAAENAMNAAQGPKDGSMVREMFEERLTADQLACFNEKSADCPEIQQQDRIELKEKVREKIMEMKSDDSTDERRVVQRNQESNNNSDEFQMPEMDEAHQCRMQALQDCGVDIDTIIPKREEIMQNVQNMQSMQNMQMQGNGGSVGIGNGNGSGQNSGRGPRNR